MSTLTQTPPQMVVIQNEQLAEQIPVNDGLAVIEQKNILILCFSDENTDSTRLLFPKGLMLKF